MKGSWHILSGALQASQDTFRSASRWTESLCLLYCRTPYCVCKGKLGDSHSSTVTRRQGGAPLTSNGVTLVLVYTFTFTTEKSCSQIVGIRCFQFQVANNFPVIITVRITFGTIAKVFCTSLFLWTESSTCTTTPENVRHIFFTCDHVLLHVGHTLPQ